MMTKSGYRYGLGGDSRKPQAFTDGTSMLPESKRAMIAKAGQKAFKTFNQPLAPKVRLKPTDGERRFARVKPRDWK